MNTPSQSQVISRELLNIVQIMLGIFSAGMGIDGFLLSSNFIDGGVTGVSMLLAKVTGVPLSVWLPLINLPFIALGYRQIGRAFAIRSVLAIAFLALVLAVVHFPDVTADLTLTAVFGGFFIGAGIGLAVRGGAVLDGTEIAALVLSKHSHLFKVGDLILGFNIVLFMLAMTVLSTEQALYSILTYVAAAKTLDFVIYGVDELTAITIISEQNAAIRTSITETLGRGVTVYRGYGGKSGAEQNILYCVVTRLEIGRIKTLIRSIDPRAFVVVHALSSAEGGVIKQSNNH